MEETKSSIDSSVDVTPTPITVVDWISDDESDDRPCSIGGLGGWFSKGMRWADYISSMKEELQPYYQALFNEIKEHDIVLYGNEHQQSDCGVPLFSDGTIGSFSYRGFADLMAAARSEIDDKDYGYMDFYYAP
jgi:hypothetical protein